MNTIYLNMKTRAELPPTVATIGFFDGVHRGHQYVVGCLKEQARRLGLPATVITFERHPRQVLQSDWQPQLLTTLDEKAALLAQLGVDQLVVLQFDRDMAALSARAFMERVLQRQLNVRLLLTGYDNRFGHNRAETFDDYVGYGRDLGMSVVAAQPFSPDGLHVSSSVVRRCLSQGDVATAARCLGRPYSLAGRVVTGLHVGTGIGFPTANLCPTDAAKLIPASGVYAVNVRLGSEGAIRRGMTNIGTRPTFHGDHLTVETHIFGFEDNIYGQPIELLFVERLRQEQRFDSREQLVAQLRQDALMAEERLALPKNGDSNA